MSEKKDWIQWDDNIEKVKGFFAPGEYELPRALIFKKISGGRLKITMTGPFVVVNPGQYINRKLELRDE